MRRSLDDNDDDDDADDEDDNDDDEDQEQRIGESGRALMEIEWKSGRSDQSVVHTLQCGRIKHTLWCGVQQWSTL